MKFEKILPGMIVWEALKRKAGNTTITTIGVYSLRIISVDPESRSVVASWNGNRPQTFYERSYKKWKAEEPITVPTFNGWAQRLATREEIKAMKAAKEQEQ